MDIYIEAQCRQMIAMMENFEDACYHAAFRDDEKFSKEEERTLKRISTAVRRFKKSVNRALTN